MSELDKLRGETWVAHCLAVAECKTLAQLHEKVPVLSSVDLWSKYRGGKAKPLESTVRVVNLMLVGTADTWFHGPLALPLWSVLALDLVVARQLVEQAIGSQPNHKDWMVASYVPVREMDNLELAQALLELSITEAWFRPRPSPDVSDLNLPHVFENIDKYGADEWLARVQEAEKRTEELEAANPRMEHIRSDNFLSLAELVVLEPNPLAHHYCIHKKLLAASKFSKKVNRYPILQPQRLLALLAAAVVSNGSDELLLKDVANFLTQGLKEAMTDLFGAGVAQFVEDNI
ncbi:hypothetical protein [Roseateles sp. PN1]|uniref:hypothetical protein n=1 Tax=Roseateles sp. PN1 TaxID=3137372 RepID=UPI003139160D